MSENNLKCPPSSLGPGCPKIHPPDPPTPPCLCFESVAATEGQSRTGSKPYQPPTTSNAFSRGWSPERRQHVMLFLASCSEGFVRKVGGGGGEFSAWQ